MPDTDRAMCVLFIYSDVQIPDLHIQKRFSSSERAMTPKGIVTFLGWLLGSVHPASLHSGAAAWIRDAATVQT